MRVQLFILANTVCTLTLGERNGEPVTILQTSAAIRIEMYSE